MRLTTLLICIALIAPSTAFAGATTIDDADVLAGDNDGRLQAPPSSSPIAVSPDDRSVWCVNHDTDTVTQFDVTNGGLRKRRAIRVGDRAVATWRSRPTAVRVRQQYRERHGVGDPRPQATPATRV